MNELFDGISFDFAVPRIKKIYVVICSAGDELSQ